MALAPRVTFLIPTFNRRIVLLHTLQQLSNCGLHPHESEVIVIDNASTDGAATAVANAFPQVHLIRLPRNQGPCAKNLGISASRAEFIVFLDDDSFPAPGSVGRMLSHFQSNPRLGAAVFTITLPDGSRECSAYPNVCIGCGTGFRKQALLAVGGLPTDYFMAAEEYDLSLRLLNLGWQVRNFPDLRATHLKTPVSRFPARITRLDARNNVLLAMRYFPDPWRMRYVAAWLERYRLMAKANDASVAFWTGAAQGLARGMAQEHQPISDEAFEQFARIGETQSRLRRAAESMNLRRVLFLDVGKNFLAYHEAARSCGLQIAAIADPRLGGRGWSYRGIPILSDTQARHLPFDAAIVSNLSPVHAKTRTTQWRAHPRNDFPVLDLFEEAMTEFAHTPAALAA